MLSSWDVSAVFENYVLRFDNHIVSFFWYEYEYSETFLTKN